MLLSKAPFVSRHHELHLFVTILKLCFGVIICGSYMILEVAINHREVEGDVVLKDIGGGLPFRPGTFDGAIRYVYNG